MSRVNNFVVKGILTDDPESKPTQNGKQNFIVNLSVESETWSKETGAVKCYLPMRFYMSGECANIVAHCRKGSEIVVMGMLVPREYNGKIYTDFKAFDVSLSHLNVQQEQGHATNQTRFQASDRPANPQQHKDIDAKSISPIAPDGTVQSVEEDDDIPF